MVLHGPWRDEQALGDRLRVEAQATPGGDLAIVLLESDYLAGSLVAVATSSDPSEVWFGTHVQRVHGIDLAAGMHLLGQVLDYQA